jgi:hypothetical protein
MTTAPFITSDRQASQAAHQNRRYRAELAMDRFGLKLASHLSTGADDLEHDFSERLRVARQQALAKRKLPALSRATASATVVGSQGSSAILGGGGGVGGGEEPGWWNRLASFLPLVVLVVGLVAIPSLQNDFRANEVAEIDAALLTDDLPPAAFTDPGFAEFIKARRAAGQ